jgi:hypothetical protein
VIITIRDWGGVEVEEETIERWIHEGIAKLKQLPYGERDFFTIASGDTLVILHGDWVEGQLYIDGKITKIEKEVSVQL